jgi:hypothetical protein
VVTPAHEHDALPLESQGTDCGGMGFAASDLLFKKELGPVTMESGLVGVFKEALMDEVWPRPAAVDPGLILPLCSSFCLVMLVDSDWRRFALIQMPPLTGTQDQKLFVRDMRVVKSFSRMLRPKVQL